MNSYTPGPWAAFLICKKEILIAQNAVGDDTGPTLAQVFGCDNEAKANARLIAASPEMVEALEYAVFKLRPMLNGDIDPTDVPMEAEDVIQECEALLRRINGKEEPK